MNWYMIGMLASFVLFVVMCIKNRHFEKDGIFAWMTIVIMALIWPMGLIAWATASMQIRLEKMKKKRRCSDGF